MCHHHIGYISVLQKVLYMYIYHQLKIKNKRLSIRFCFISTHQSHDYSSCDWSMISKKMNFWWHLYRRFASSKFFHCTCMLICKIKMCIRIRTFKFWSVMFSIICAYKIILIIAINIIPGKGCYYICIRTLSQTRFILATIGLVYTYNDGAQF